MPPFLKLLVLAVGMLSSAHAAESEPVVIDDPIYAHPQRLVEVESGRRLNIHCTGNGSPAVIIDAGLTEPTSSWGLVQPMVAAKTMVCSYDRAGVGFSDAGQRAGSSANIVDDLHRLLAAAAIKPPYVLVGHSYGGMNVRLFAHVYPSEVVGMVLVDPSHEDQREGYRKLDPEKRTSEQWDAYAVEPSLKLRRECVSAADSGFTPGTDIHKKCSFPQYPQLSAEIQAATARFQLRRGFQQAQLSEEENIFRASSEQVRAARRRFGDMPLVVLTASPPLPPKDPITPEKWAHRQARYQMWAGLHASLAASSLRGVQRVVPET
ncbi:MAG TPA: alpha/beta hydrolase, partial [Lysobacter sp.]|nr:alpha/beta hydrolase [Lysobacter sp.]